MCGDGTNDVGALKHAHVGVSILSNSTLVKKKKTDPKSIESSNNSAIAPVSSGVRRAGDARNNRVDNNLSPRERAIARHRENMTNTQDLLQKALKDIDEEQVQIVKLGDASIAAPFTSKLSSIQCGKCDIIIHK